MVFIAGKKIEIFDHELVPKHEILSEEEVKDLLSRYNVTKNQLPKILDTDPAVKELNAKIGDVIRITRKSFTAGESVYYRVVVSSKYVAEEDVDYPSENSEKLEEEEGLNSESSKEE